MFNAIHKDDKTKIILHFGEDECMSCVKECILDLLTVVDLIGKENIFITGSFRNDTSFYSSANKLDTVFTHIPFKEFSPVCGVKKPLILVVDKYDHIKAIYISDLLSNKNRYTFFNKTLPSIL